MLPWVEVWKKTVLLLSGGQAAEIQWESDLAEGTDARLFSNRQRWLLLAVYRHWRRLQFAVDQLVPKSPRPRLRALLMLGMAEMDETAEESERRPQIIHHAVSMAREYLSVGESRLVNAVLRKYVDFAFPEDDISLRHSHPQWLYNRWKNNFGADEAHRLMEWNQMPAPFYLHVENEFAELLGADTDWPNFRFLNAKDWPQALETISQGQAYLQDPATRYPVALAKPQPGERVLDLCASPGGKSWGLAHEMAGIGSLAVVDLPGPRQERLRQNLKAIAERFPELEIKSLEADLLAPDWADGLGDLYDAVLIDVPCSNTGVIRRKPDVRIRLSEAALKKLPPQQLLLLQQAAAMVKPGGRLVYSTCSLEPEENEQVVEHFLAGAEDFEQTSVSVSLPFREGHDGGAAFLLTKRL